MATQQTAKLRKIDTVKSLSPAEKELFNWNFWVIEQALSSIGILTPGSTASPPVSIPIRHDQLLELADDDHLQYLLLAGRNGQTIETLNSYLIVRGNNCLRLQRTDGTPLFEFKVGANDTSLKIGSNSFSHPNFYIAEFIGQAPDQGLRLRINPDWPGDGSSPGRFDLIIPIASSASNLSGLQIFPVSDNSTSDLIRRQLQFYAFNDTLPTSNSGFIFTSQQGVVISNNDTSGSSIPLTLYGGITNRTDSFLKIRSGVPATGGFTDLASITKDGYYLTRRLYLNGSTSGTLGIFPVATVTSYDLIFPGAIGTANQLVGFQNVPATGLEYKTLVAGTNITIVHGVGTITINSSGGVANHNLLDGSVHPDTLAKSPGLGDIIYGDGSDWTTLVGHTASIKKFLTQTGAAGVSAAPVWFDLFNTLNTWSVLQTYTGGIKSDAYSGDPFIKTYNSISGATTTLYTDDGAIGDANLLVPKFSCTLVGTGSTVTGRIPFWASSGLLTNDPDLSFSGDTLGATKGNFPTSIKVGSGAEITKLDVGTYTPTVTGISNVDSVSAALAQYYRLGNVVTVSGRITVNPTSVDTITYFRISLPIASNFANDYEAAGTSNSQLYSREEAGTIYANSATDDVTCIFKNTASSADAHDIWYHFTYLVI